MAALHRHRLYPVADGSRPLFIEYPKFRPDLVDENNGCSFPSFAKPNSSICAMKSVDYAAGKLQWKACSSQRRWKKTVVQG